MRMAVSDNAAQVERDLDALADRINRARIRAINTVLPQVQKAGFAAIATVYQIKPATMSQYASQKLAAQGDTEASITVKGKGFSLSEFTPRQTAAGVVVTIKGRDVLFPHAFMVPSRFGNNVFARGAYGGKGVSRPTGESFGRFQFDRGGIGARHGLPINKFYTFSPPDAFSNAEVIAAMDDAADVGMQKQLERELAAAGRGY